MGMFINVGSRSKKKNTVIEVIEGVPVIQYGHVGDRYKKRISKFYELTKINKLRFASMIDECLKVITDNIDEIKSSKETKKYIIHYEVPVIIDMEPVVVEMCVLITRSKVSFLKEAPAVIAEDYKAAYDLGFIKLDEIAVCIETVAVAIKKNNEKVHTFSDFEILSSKTFTNKEKKVTKEQFKTTIENMYRELIFSTKVKPLRNEIFAH